MCTRSVGRCAGECEGKFKQPQLATLGSSRPKVLSTQTLPCLCMYTSGVDANDNDFGGRRGRKLSRTVLCAYVCENQ